MILSFDKSLAVNCNFFDEQVKFCFLSYTLQWTWQLSEYYLITNEVKVEFDMD